jgi:hypothetical protein
VIRTLRAYRSRPVGRRRTIRAVLARMRRAPRPALVDGAILLALGGATAALYGGVVHLWWTHDDFFQLRTLLGRRPYWYFVHVSDYHDMPGGLLTPLLFFSLDVDRRLFGIDPRPFYLHQLAALSACVSLLYGVLRLWFTRPWAMVAAWVFLVGPVTASMAPLLMVRHYVEATVLATLSVAAWAVAARRPAGTPAWCWSWLSAALYFAACMAKEIAVPLVALLPLLPPGVAFRERIRTATPHLAACASYLAVRYLVLDTPLGAYGFAVTPSDVPGLALELPAKIAREFVGGHVSPVSTVFALALAAGLSALVLAPSGRRAIALTGFALLLAALPVLVVSTRMEPRYAAPAWLVVALAFTLGCRSLAAGADPRRRLAALAIAVVACTAGLGLNRQDWRVRLDTAERMSVENRFILEMKEGDVLRRPLTLAASLVELEWMKEKIFGRPRGGRWFQDDLFLCLHREVPGRISGYDPDARRVVDLSGRIGEVRGRYCGSIRDDAPLAATFRIAGSDLFWELGPHRSGKYRFVIDDGRVSLEMPARAGFHLRGWPPLLTLRVAYESPAGWVTYSPELPLRLSDGWTLRWSRP